ncbi:hypothetical protein P7K49_029896, partial [Saguinus oedipus]
ECPRHEIQKCKVLLGTLIRRARFEKEMCSDMKERLLLLSLRQRGPRSLWEKDAMEPQGQSVVPLTDPGDTEIVDSHEAKGQYFAEWTQFSLSWSERAHYETLCG